MKGKLTGWRFPDLWNMACSMTVTRYMLRNMFIKSCYHSQVITVAIDDIVSHYNDVIMSPMASQIISLNDCLLSRRSKKTSKLRVTGLCEGNSPVTGEFPTQRASNVGNVYIWWRHHVYGFRPSDINVMQGGVYQECLGVVNNLGVKFLHGCSLNEMVPICSAKTLNKLYHITCHILQKLHQRQYCWMQSSYF